MSFAVNSIVAILLLARRLRASDAVEHDVRSHGRRLRQARGRHRDGVAGIFGYLGGALFTLAVGQLANTPGFEPLFAVLFLFDLIAAAAISLFIGGQRQAALARGAPIKDRCLCN